MSEPHLPPPGPPSLLTEQQLNSLCKNGYIDVVLPDHLKAEYTTLFTAAAAFFTLPESTKQSSFPSKPNDTEQGYTLIPSEKEYLSLRHLSNTSSLHPDSAVLESHSSNLWSGTASFLLRALVDISRYLNLDPYAWEELVESCLSLPSSNGDATPTLFRVFRYEAGTGVADPHRDLGLLTLCVGKGRGLQVLPSPIQEEGKVIRPEWIDAGEVTLLTGDTLRVLSGNRLKAGLHRVVGNEKGRYSAVFALRIDTRPLIDLGRFGDGEGVVSAKELWEGIRRSRVNVNAQKDIRERQRMERKGRDVC